jgi:hypothetical protein
MCICELQSYVKRDLKNVYNVNIIVTRWTSAIEEFKQVHKSWLMQTKNLICNSPSECFK